MGQILHTLFLTMLKKSTLIVEVCGIHCKSREISPQCYHLLCYQISKHRAVGWDQLGKTISQGNQMKLNTIQKPTKEKQPTKLKHIACSVHTPSNHPFISIRVLKWKHTCMLHIWQKLSAYTLHKHSAPSPFQKGFLALPPECQCMSERQSGYRGLN